MSSLTLLQKDRIKTYLKDRFWDNSPLLIIMDFTGRCWGISETQFGNFYNKDSNVISNESKANSYNKTDSSTYRKFGGWDKSHDDCMWNKCGASCGLTGQLNMSHPDGYNKVNDNWACPSRDADGKNYFDSDDKKKFDNNRKKRLFTWSSESPPNAIAGYYRVSRNNSDVPCINHPLKNLKGENVIFANDGFITLNRSSSKHDVAFILFVRYLNKDEFADDIINNHKSLIDRILNEKYDLNTINNCMKYIETPTRDFDWNFNQNLQFVKSGLSLDGDGNNIYTGSYDPNNKYKQWVRQNSLIKHVASGKCLDADGNRVYYGECSNENPFQQWTFEGNRIIHNDSGRCLTLNDNTISLADCSCRKKLLNDIEFRLKYEDMIAYESSKCVNKTNMSYDRLDNCEAVIANDDAVGSKLINWCLDNESIYTVDSCATILNGNHKYLDNYVHKLCSKNDNIVNNAYCHSYMNRAITNKDDELYNKIAYDSLLTEWCIRTENTNNPNRNDDNNYKCNYLKKRNNYINQDDYNAINAFWKSHNCVNDLPVLLFFKIINQSLDEQKKYLKTKFINNKFIYARNLCYSGDALETNQFLLPNQCLYSQNKKYKACLLSNGDFRIFDNEKKTSTSISDRTNNGGGLILNMQSDGNLVCYSHNSPYWASSTFGDNIFAVMRNDGHFVLYNDDGKIIKDFAKSNFHNKHQTEDFIKNNIIEEEWHTDLIYLILSFIFIILFVAAVITIRRRFFHNNDNIPDDPSLTYT